MQETCEKGTKTLAHLHVATEKLQKKLKNAKPTTSFKSLSTDMLPVTITRIYLLLLENDKRIRYLIMLIDILVDINRMQ